jgi:hypothetical protein
MRIFTRSVFPAFRRTLRRLGRRLTPSTRHLRRRRPPRHGTLAQPLPPSRQLWQVDHAELQQALERSWH